MAKYHIILGAHVYKPPNDPTAPSYGMISDDLEWYCFKFGVHTYGSEGLTQEGLTIDGLIESLDSSWESYVMQHGIRTCD